MVKLGSVFIVNQIKMRLSDDGSFRSYNGHEDNREYSYYIEVSVDEKNWHRIIDHTNYKCHSIQNLYFSSQAIRFIKLVGTQAMNGRYFHVTELQAYNSGSEKLINGVVSPRFNVIRHGWDPFVIEGKYLNRNALLNGNNCTNYNNNSAHNSHISYNRRSSTSIESTISY